MRVTFHAVLLQRPQEQVAFVDRHRVLEQAAAGARFPIQSSDLQLDRQVVLGNPRLVGDGDTSCSIMFSSSRMLPGQSATTSSALMAFSEIPSTCLRNFVL